ncbi:hypothetical protein Barb7_00880 [Bacteroidales bacterium Barb7]|nr:hypothetical protein Barb7_00880 [Bacteroidales bacterium Barb7]
MRIGVNCHPFTELQLHSQLFNLHKKTNKMAIPIRDLPTLTGRDAERFIKKANEAYKRKGTVDFSKEMENARIILANSKL